MADASLTTADLLDLGTRLERRFNAVEMRLDKFAAQPVARCTDVSQHMAEMAVRLEKRLTRTGWVAGTAGCIAAIPADIAVSIALAWLCGGHTPGCWKNGPRWSAPPARTGRHLGRLACAANGR
jgi:hypothetical protein